MDSLRADTKKQEEFENEFTAHRNSTAAGLILHWIYVHLLFRASTNVLGILQESL